MGYSFYTPCRSRKARDEMFAFLKEHYRPFSVLAAGSGCLDEIADQQDLDNREWEHRDCIRGPLKDDLSYTTSKCYIGFDFGFSGGAEGTWMKDFCRWVATKVGRLRTFPDVEGKVPYVVYDIPAHANDRDSIWPVLERSEFTVTRDMKSFLVDRGFRGWARQVDVMRKHSRLVARERAKRDNWTKRELAAHLAKQTAFWDLQERIAERADEYIKAELQRLDNLWEER